MFGNVTVGELTKAETYDRFLLSDALEIVNDYKDIIPVEVIDIVSGVTFRDLTQPKTLLSKIQVVPVFDLLNTKLKLGFDRSKMDKALGTTTFYDFFFKVHTTCKTINLSDLLDMLFDRWAPAELIGTFTEDSLYDLYTTPKDVLGKVVVADVFKFSFIPAQISDGLEIALCDITVGDCIDYKTLPEKLYIGRMLEGIDKMIGGKYVIATDEMIELWKDYTVNDLIKSYKEIAQGTMLTEVMDVISSYLKEVQFDISGVDYLKDLTVYDLIEKPQYLIAVGAYGGLYFWYEGEIPQAYFDLANEFAAGGVWDLKVTSTFAVIEELFQKISGKTTDIIKDQVYTLFEGWTYESFKSTDALKAISVPAIIDAVNAYKQLINREVADVFVLADGHAMTIGDLMTAEMRNQIVINNLFAAVESYFDGKDYIKQSVYDLFEGVTLETAIKKDTYLDMSVWNVYKVAEEYIVGEKTDGIFGRIMSEDFQEALSGIISTWQIRDLAKKDTYLDIKLGNVFDLVNFAIDKFIFKQSFIDLFDGWMIRDVANVDKLLELKVNNIYLVLSDYSSILPEQIRKYVFSYEVEEAVLKLFDGKMIKDFKSKSFYKSLIVADLFDLVNAVLVPNFEQFLGDAFYELASETAEDGSVRKLTVGEMFTKDGLLDLNVGLLADAALQIASNFGKDLSVPEDIMAIMDDMTIRELISNKANLVIIGGAGALWFYFKGDIPDSVVNFIKKLDVDASGYKEMIAEITVGDTIEMIKAFGYYPSILPLDVYDVIRDCKIVGIIDDPVNELGMLTLGDIAKFSFIPQSFKDILNGENISKVTIAAIKESKAAAFKDVTVGELTATIESIPAVFQNILSEMNLGNCFLENGLMNELKSVRLASFMRDSELFEKLGEDVLNYLTDEERNLTIGDLIDNPAAALGDIKLSELFSMLGTFDEKLLNALGDITLTDFLDKKLEVFYDIKIGDLFDLGDSSAAAVIKDMSINDIRNGKLDDVMIGELLGVIESIDEVTGEITYKDGTSPFIEAFGGMTLETIKDPDQLRETMNNLELRAFFEDENSLPQVLKALLYQQDGTTPVKLSELSDRINSLTIKDAFGENREGILKALGDDTLLVGDNGKGLQEALNEAMFGTSYKDIKITIGADSALDIDMSAQNPDNEVAYKDLADSDKDAIKAALAALYPNAPAFEGANETSNYYYVIVTAREGEQVTLTAVTRATLTIMDIVDGNMSFDQENNTTIQELIFKLNQKPSIPGVDEIPGNPDSWWDLILKAA